MTNYSAFHWSEKARKYAETIGTVFNVKGRVDTVADLPSTGNKVGDLYLVGLVSSADKEEYAWLNTDNNPHWEKLGSTSISLTWGNISGTLSNQTDLNTALGEKADSDDLGTLAYADAITNGDISGTINQDKITNLATTLAGKQDNLPTLVSGQFLTNNGTTLSWSAVDALPSQSGQSGKFLTTNGTTSSWGTTVVPSDSSTQYKVWTGTLAQYNAISTKDANTLYNITDDTDIGLTVLQTIYPVGSIYITTNSTCPLAALFGTWELVAADRVLQGAGSRGSVGTTLSESLPNITGDFSIGKAGYWSNTHSSSGSFSLSNNTSTEGNSSSSSSGGGTKVSFNASLSSSTYQDNAPVQSDAYLVNIYRRTA